MSIRDKVTEVATKHKKFSTFQKEMTEIRNKEFGILADIVNEEYLKRIFFEVHQYVR